MKMKLSGLGKTQLRARLAMAAMNMGAKNLPATVARDAMLELSLQEGRPVHRSITKKELADYIARVLRLKPELSLEQRAIALLSDSPGLTNAELAEELKCHVKSLSRLPRLKKIRDTMSPVVRGRKRRGRGRI